jgi:hypothetical protein
MIAACMPIVLALAAIGSAAPAPADDTVPATRGCCAVFELRQYTLRPQQRDVLIGLFEDEFVETQEATGMRIVGQFRDADRPDRFVWIRAFPDMVVRQHALTSFYQGPVWKAHGKRAAATMIDASDVLLLRPVEPPNGFDNPPATRAPIGASTLPGSVVTATIYPLEPVGARDFGAFFQSTVRPALRNAGIIPLATFETETAPNNYPLLPVREGETVFVWFASFESAAARAAALERLSRGREWAQAEASLATHLKSPAQQLRLQPTARSLLQ